MYVLGTGRPAAVPLVDVEGGGGGYAENDDGALIASSSEMIANADIVLFKL